MKRRSKNLYDKNLDYQKTYNGLYVNGERDSKVEKKWICIFFTFLFKKIKHIMMTTDDDWKTEFSSFLLVPEKKKWK